MLREVCAQEGERRRRSADDEVRKKRLEEASQTCKKIKSSIFLTSLVPNPEIALSIQFASAPSGPAGSGESA